MDTKTKWNLQVDFDIALWIYPRPSHIRSKVTHFGGLLTVKWHISFYQWASFWVSCLQLSDAGLGDFFLFTWPYKFAWAMSSWLWIVLWGCVLQSSSSTRYVNVEFLFTVVTRFSLYLLSGTLDKPRSQHTSCSVTSSLIKRRVNLLKFIDVLSNHCSCNFKLVFAIDI